MNPAIAARAMGLIQLERKRQDETWGDQAHHPDMTWLAILVEEVGELSRVVLHARFNGHDGTWDNAIEEATQVAAVATAWLEALMFRKQRGDEL